MKRLLFAFLLIGCGTSSSIYSQADYGKTVVSFSGLANAAIEDLKDVLKDYRAGTIVLQRVPLGDRSGQEFFLEIKGNQTTIRYTTQNSLENGIYTYLDMLGFRWYGPGDNWFVRPQHFQRENFEGRWIQPSFRNRNFFGTGGLSLPRDQTFDPTNTFKAKWEAWMRRNRFNADFPGVGHQGEAFYTSNKELLDKNPSWFADEKGKKAGRLKIDNAAAVKAYKDWIRTKYRSAKGDFIVLGVDPADGRGGPDDPLPPKMPGIENYADKWWWLANEVAKDYENDKHVVVSMYAYGNGPENAKVPSFPLRENVYPVIIPYAFQTAYLPDEMVKIWAASVTGKMGIYDYWNITQWSHSTPQFDIYTMVPKLKFWVENKVDGVYLESTNSAGPMGHALWLAGQLEWNINKNLDTLYHQYLNDCFGDGAPYMKNMFDRWSKNYQGAADVSFSLQDLKNASAAVKKDSPEWKRINELKAYVHYLKMYYEHDGTQQSKDKIFRYLYSIHHLLMVQTSAFIGQQYIPPFDKGNIVPSGVGVRRLTASDIEQQFANDLAVVPPPYQLTNVEFDYAKVQYLEPIPELSWRFGGFQCNLFFRAPFTGRVSLEAGAETTTPLKIFTDDTIIIDEEVGEGNYDKTETLTGRTWKLKAFTFDVEEGKFYQIRTRYGYSRVKINSPGIVILKNPGLADFDNYQYPVQYFYVPKSATEIVFYDKEPEGTNRRGYLIAPDGTRMLRESAGFKDVYRVSVAPEYRGKLWTADFGHPSWKFLNIPNVTSLQKFGYEE
ncbi:MAG: DUF4838 domain-containing protein [Chitinophagaceae bacterium]|nr:DUF4838 domain-containing protein [Chitinophagaceae bacterium]